MTRRNRRLISAAIAACFALSFAEAVAGEVRDGNVHHETSVEALSHAETTPLGHGHTKGTAQRTGQDGGDHEHDGPSDHCTHVHGAALPASALDFAATTDLWLRLADDVRSVIPPPSNPIPHPPRA